jgi:hypothetical protein
VWDRLPRPFRWWRLASTLLAAAIVLLLAPALIFAGSDVVRGAFVNGEPLVRAAGALLTGAFAVVAVLGVVNAALQIPCATFMRSRGFDTYTLRRATRALLIAPTSNREVWKRPELVQLLLPAGGRAGEPASPAALASAISELARGAPTAAHAVVAEAVVAARRLGQQLQELETEVVRLAAEADPAERARLDERLVALGPVERDDAERGRLRALLTEQRELLLRMAARAEEAAARRHEVVQALRELWRALSDLRAVPAGGEAAPAERVRACCQAVTGPAGGPPADTVTRAN